MTNRQIVARSTNALVSLCAVALATAAVAQEKFPAPLSGHAFIPALTLVPAPADAPASLSISGKYTGQGGREDQLGTIEGTSFLSASEAPRTTGISLPFEGQPVQGFSGIKSLGNGEYVGTSDNGFGSKANSPDAILLVHRIKPDWSTGEVELLETIFLHDPDKILPFHIVNEATDSRYLTGGDLDIESFQPIGDRLWFGDEFGPHLIATDGQGKVVAFFDTEVDGEVVRSPDNHGVRMPSVPGDVDFEVRRSRGFEGMAASPDGMLLYPLLEGPLWLAETGEWESQDGHEYLRILEFNVDQAAFTGRTWKYLLEENGNNIGDFNMVDAQTGLIIERDSGEGDPGQACAGEPEPDCFNTPAQFKRIYKIDLSQADTDGFVKKVGYIDLMDIDDPNGEARLGGGGGKFTFPFVTIENVDVVDEQHIIVANDNNLPFSSGRTIGENDANEFILLEVPELLSAR